MKISYSVPTEGAILEIASRMSAADQAEVMACSGNTPEQAIRESIQLSEVSIVYYQDGRPEAIFGVSPFAVGVASPWLLATEEVRKKPREFLHASKYWIASFDDQYGTLFNLVDARHKRAIKWLRYLGFEEVKTHPEYGVARIPFIEMVRYLDV